MRASENGRERERESVVCVRAANLSHQFAAVLKCACVFCGVLPKEQTNTKPLRDAIRNVSEVLGFELRFAYSAALYINIYLVGHRDFSTSCQRSVQRAYTHTHAPRKEWERERVSNGNNNKSLSAATFLVMSSESKLIFSLCAVCFSVFLLPLGTHTNAHAHKRAQRCHDVIQPKYSRLGVVVIVAVVVVFLWGNLSSISQQSAPQPQYNHRHHNAHSSSAQNKNEPMPIPPRNRNWNLNWNGFRSESVSQTGWQIDKP